MLESYTRWVYHGEPFETVNESEVYSEDEDEDMNESNGNDRHIHEAVNYDDMGRMISDLQGGNFFNNENGDVPLENQDVSEGEADKFERLLKDAQQELYPGCQNYSKLSFLIKLLHIKTLSKWSNKSYNMLVELLRDAFNVVETLPKSYYEAKNVMRDLGLGYVNIHACPNDCALFWKENEHLDFCPNKKCNASRWKAKTAKGRKIPQKVLRYFPLKTRLQRLFMSKQTAKDMRWHKDMRLEQDQFIRHPADGKAWKDFDKEHEWFSNDSRNVRLGLASDGFNPFGNMSNSYSMWPVMLVIYNLPPWMCMTEPFILMSFLIPGPSSPGNDIDVYLRPLIDELNELWEEGVQTYDAYTGEKFKLHAAVLWTINDFPAYGMLSGWSTRGKLACPPCNKDTHSLSLKNGKKQCYMGHRRFLDMNHKWRRSYKFDGKKEFDPRPKDITGDDILRQLDSIPKDLVLGKPPNSRKRKRTEPELNWRKRSIFFELPYWKTLKLRHNLDVMHIEKNICESLLGTLMNTEGKTKDNIKSRLDLELMGIKKELHIKKDGNTKKIPPACYTFSSNEKKKFCEWLKNVKFPDGYASNIARRVNIKDNKILGMKSHDYHVLLQRLLPIAIRGTLRKDVCLAITELAYFFKELCSKTLNLEVLEKLENDIILILCKLEMIYPPSFFDVMVHLAVHLPNEAKLGGPVQYRWMYFIERFLHTLKEYVRNKARPEGSIAEAYIDSECLNFCSMYLDGVETKFNTTERNHDAGTCHRSGNISVFSSTARLLGAATDDMLQPADFDKIRWYVLNNCEEIEPYLLKHRAILESENPVNVQQRHEKGFAKWFETYMVKRHLENSPEATKELYHLACGPDKRVTRYHSCVVNGIKFHTKDHDEHRTTQNSGVVVKGDHMSEDLDFYGVLTDIIELNYLGRNTVIVFKCDWWNVGDKKTGVKKDEHFTSVNVSRKWYKDDPFVLASQVEQVFYVPDTVFGNDYKIVQRLHPRNLYDVPEQSNEEDDRADIHEDCAYQQKVTENNDDIFEVIVEDVGALHRSDMDPSIITDDMVPSYDHGKDDDINEQISDDEDVDETMFDYFSDKEDSASESDDDSDIE